MSEVQPTEGEHRAKHLPEGSGESHLVALKMGRTVYLGKAVAVGEGEQAEREARANAELWASAGQLEQQRDQLLEALKAVAHGQHGEDGPVPEELKAEGLDPDSWYEGFDTAEALIVAIAKEAIAAAKGDSDE